MSLKSKVSISVCVLLAVSMCIYAQVPSAHSWGEGTHQFITQNAINVMPSNLSWFFTGYENTLELYCTLPDAWKATDPMEGYRHYDDTDIPHGGDAVLTPDNYLGKEILLYQESAISGYANGTLPWTLVDNFNMLVVCLEENDWNHAAQLAGVIAHYVEDASMPLHAIANYNPGGNHTRYESWVDREVSLDNVNANVPGFVPHKLDNIFDSTMQLLNDSYSNTPVLSFYLETNVLWNDEIKTITENRVQTGIEQLADVWYTAFLQAGISTSPLSGQGVQVSILPQSQTGSPGENLTFTVTITNTGTNTDNFSLTVSDTKSWSPTLSITSTTLAAGTSSQNIKLSIKIPNTAANGDSTTITVKASGIGYENSATCTAVAKAISGGISPLVYVGVAVVIVVIIAVILILKVV